MFIYTLDTHSNRPLVASDPLSPPSLAQRESKGENGRDASNKAAIENPIFLLDTQPCPRSACAGSSMFRSAWRTSVPRPASTATFWASRRSRGRLPSTLTGAGKSRQFHGRAQAATQQMCFFFSNLTFFRDRRSWPRGPFLPSFFERMRTLSLHA